MMPLASSDTELVPVASHDQNCHVAHDFECLDMRNVMFPLKVLLASSDANAGAVGVMWHIKLCGTPF